MRKQYLIVLILFFSSNLMAQTNCVTVKKIWDNGKHNAFTSLIKFKDAYYCSFREGETHIFDSSGKAEGKVRILKSIDGKNWKSVAYFGKDNYDLRDPKLSITPDHRLMVTIGGSIYEGWNLTGRNPMVVFSDDGECFSDLIPVKIHDNAGNGKDWIWRVTWHKNIGYTAMYSMTADREAYLTLLSTKDGINYKFVSKLEVPNFPNEATIRFDSDDKMYIMVRRDIIGCWGKSNYPYVNWEWKDMDIRLGGPDFIFLDDNTTIMGTRSHYTSIPKTVLLTGKGTEKFEEVYVLPSGGDNSYTGFQIAEDELWVSYYSTHETKNSSIYIAKMPLNIFESKK